MKKVAERMGGRLFGGFAKRRERMEGAREICEVNENSEVLGRSDRIT